MYAFCCTTYDTYRRSRDDASPDEGPRTSDANIPPSSDDHFLLDGDWNVADNYATADRAEKRQLLEHIRLYCEADSEARPRSVKDILEIVRRGFQASR